MTEYATALRNDARAWVERVKHLDVMVGIPSYNNQDTIGHVAKMAAEGLAQYLPEMKAAIVNSDGGSSDQTRQVVRSAPVPDGIQVLATEYQGLPGKGSALRAIFEVAAALDAKACVVVDSDLRSITPEWIERLGGPVARNGFDYVAPLYTRHKHDGTITNNITYPMTRMLYGLDVRQPIGGDFGFSGQLARWWLAQDVWDTDVARYGIDIWMTTTAIAEGFKVGQAGLGLKIHDAKDPAASLGPMFTQVVGTQFSLMGRYADKWQAVKSVQPSPRIGELPQGEPEAVPVTISALTARLREGVRAHADLLGQVLGAERRTALKGIAAYDDATFKFPAVTWARIVFDFAAAHNKGSLPPEQLMMGLVPVYYGRTAAMAIEAHSMDSAAFEQHIVQAQAEIFQKLKPELVARWQA